MKNGGLFSDTLFYRKYEVVVDGNHVVRSINSCIQKNGVLSSLDKETIITFTKNVLNALRKENIIIKHVFFDGGDDYQSAFTYIKRSLEIMEASKQYFEEGNHNKAKDMYVSCWSRFIIMKEICKYVGEKNVSFGGLNTDK